MDEFTDWYRLELVRQVLVEDAQTHKIHKERGFLIYDPMRNLWLDAAGQSSAFRNDLFRPFTNQKEAESEVARLNAERIRNRRQEENGPVEWPGDKTITRGV